MSLRIYRTRKATMRQILNLCVMLAVSGYFLYQYQSSGWTYDVVCGVIFGIWGLYVLWHVVTRKVRFQETVDGFEAVKAFGTARLHWDQLIAHADPALESRIIFLVYRDTPDGKDRYLALSKRILGEEESADVIALINTKRPDLALFADGKVQPRDQA